MVDSSTLELGGLESSGWWEFLFFVCSTNEFCGDFLVMVGGCVWETMGWGVVIIIMIIWERRRGQISSSMASGFTIGVGGVVVVVAVVPVRRSDGGLRGAPHCYVLSRVLLLLVVVVFLLLCS